MDDDSLRLRVKHWADQKPILPQSSFREVVRRAGRRRRRVVATVGGSLAALLAIGVLIPLSVFHSQSHVPTASAEVESKTWVLATISVGTENIPLPEHRGSLKFSGENWDASDGNNDHTGVVTWSGESVTLHEKGVSEVAYTSTDAVTMNELIETYFADKTLVAKVDATTLKLTSATEILTLTGS